MPAISHLFKKLGAPLKNLRWSWGAMGADGKVVLRVWTDQEIQRDGAWFTQVTYRHIAERGEEKLGNAERFGHVALIAAGAPSYMIMCQAKKRDEIPRTIASFNEHELFPGGRLLEWDGNHWIERLPRVPVGSVTTP